MRRTSPVTSRLSSRGFTLVELVVVIFVLLLLATAVVPRVVAIQKSRRLKDMEGRIIRLPIEARNEAVRAATPVRLRVDGAALVMERAPVNGTPEMVKRVPLGSGIQVESVRLGDQPSNTGSWQWTVYPDGSADEGGIQFAEGASEKSLLLTSQGDARWILGDLPDGTPERWPAGQLRQRT